MIDVSDFDKADVLRVLYNAAKVQGMGIYQAVPGDMTHEEATDLMADDHSRYFDYLHGRVMKVEIGGDAVDPRLYDHDNGDGAALRAINTLRAELPVALET